MTPERFEKSGANGASACIIVVGRVRTLRSPLFGRTGDERTLPFSFTNGQSPAEGEFWELRRDGVPRSSPRKFQISLIWGMRLVPEVCYTRHVLCNGRSERPPHQQRWERGANEAHKCFSNLTIIGGSRTALGVCLGGASRSGRRIP